MERRELCKGPEVGYAWGLEDTQKPAWLEQSERRGWKCREVKGQDAPSSAHGWPLTTAAGFITMTPQLFINYKLKSVAHLPWRMLTYKALNTFIDDLFAFVIKMPVMYRIGCLRDGEARWAGGRLLPALGTGRALVPGRCPGPGWELRLRGSAQSLQDHLPRLTAGPVGPFCSHWSHPQMWSSSSTSTNGGSTASTPRG